MFPGSLNTNRRQFVFCRLFPLFQNLILTLWSNIILSSRLKGIEIVHTASACIHAGQGSEPHTIDPTRVIVHARQILLLNTVNPECESTIVSSYSHCRTPVHLNYMGSITDREPVRHHKGGSII